MSVNYNEWFGLRTQAQTIRFKEVSVLPKVQSWPPVFCKTVKGTNIIIFFSMYEYDDDAVHLFFLLIYVMTKFLETSLTEIIKCLFFRY